MESETLSPPELPIAKRIRETAHNLFYRDGIRATGVDRIIVESGVAKKTFYRYYPAKNILILTFLEHRHRSWMVWFEDALIRHGGNAIAIVATLEEWFESDIYRGCAFINAVVELGGTFPAVVDISRRHKSDMILAIKKVLSPTSETVDADARALAIAIDGAIICAQFGEPTEVILKSLSRIVRVLDGTAVKASKAGKTATKTGRKTRSTMIGNQL